MAGDSSTPCTRTPRTARGSATRPDRELESLPAAGRLDEEIEHRLEGRRTDRAE